MIPKGRSEAKIPDDSLVVLLLSLPTCYWSKAQMEAN